MNSSSQMLKGPPRQPAQPPKNSPLQEAILRLQEDSFSTQEDREAYIRGLDDQVMASVFDNASFYNANIQDAIRSVKQELGIPVEAAPPLPNIPEAPETPEVATQAGGRRRSRSKRRARSSRRARKPHTRAYSRRSRSKRNGTK